jgi:ectoine hydroxylase-related dioxygenase (phytanoyl-CoA dioxygenase family)
VFEDPTLAAVAAGSLLQLARERLGSRAFAVRGLIFDKTPLANWKVTWHQDVTIAVTDRRELEGWGPWSQKAGTWQVRPPAKVLESMLALRLHLDDSTADNGPLRVLPGSHRAGRLSDAAVSALSHSGTPRDCLVQSGGVLLMRPLLLHASAPATVPGHRRVLHIEYAASALPAGLVWAEQLAGAA